MPIETQCILKLNLIINCPLNILDIYTMYAQVFSGYDEICRQRARPPPQGISMSASATYAAASVICDGLGEATTTRAHPSSAARRHHTHRRRHAGRRCGGRGLPLLYCACCARVLPCAYGAYHVPGEPPLRAPMRAACRRTSGALRRRAPPSPPAGGARLQAAVWVAQGARALGHANPRLGRGL